MKHTLSSFIKELQEFMDEVGDLPFKIDGRQDFGVYVWGDNDDYIDVQTVCTEIQTLLDNQ